MNGLMKNRHIRRIVSFVSMPILIFMYTIFLPSYTVQADVGSLIVQGGSIGTGGLGLGASSLGLLGPVGVILTAALGSAGININISEESAEAGMTRTQYCMDQIMNWKDNSNQAVSYLCTDVINGASVGLDGVIYLTDIACDAIRQLGNWIVSDANENFYDGDITQIPSTPTNEVYIGDTPFVQIESGMILNTDNAQRYAKISNYTAQQPVYALRGDGKNYLFISKGTFSFNLTWYNTSNAVQAAIYPSSGQFSGSWRTAWSGHGSMATITSFPYHAGLTASTYKSFVAGLSGTVTETPAVSDLPDTFWGDKSAWTDFVGGLALPDGYMGAIDTGIIADMQAELDQTKDYIITLEDYIEALEDALNNESVADVPVEDVEDGTIVLTPDIPLVPDPVYEQVAPDDIPAPEEKTVVADPDKIADPESLIAMNTLQLKDVFPFCIPFDLYSILQKFNTSPVTPVYRIQFTLPVINYHVDMTIDLTPFNTVAAVLRAMELVAAVVGLAIATRRIYLRS